MEKIETSLEKKGLKRVSHLEEVLDQKFLVDSNYANNEDMQISIYPIARKKNLAHNLLNLYGTHWRYSMNPDNWKEIERIEGNLDLVLRNIRIDKKVKRVARYAFSQNYLNKFKSLWIFESKTEAWQYHQKVLVPKFNSDIQEYKTQKRNTELQN